MDSLPLAAVVAFAAGLLTVLAPCTLPVIPIVVGGASSGGRLRAVGIALGFGTSFVVTAILLASALAALGLTTSPLRVLSAIALALLGLTLAVPALGELAARRLAPLSGLGARAVAAGGAPAADATTARGGGLAGGVVIGAAIGLLWAPCAGPLLAAALALAVSQGPTIDAIVVGAAYAAGAAVPLLLIAGLGRRVVASLGSPVARQRAQQVLGVTMIAASAVTLAGLPTPGLDTAATAAAVPTAQASAAAAEVPLEDLGPAPELAGITAWINSSPLTLASLRGKVVLVHFWTFACINCRHVQPYVKAWWAEYASQGLVVVGVHTPELSFERDLSNVRDAVRDQGVTFPVAFDPDFATWHAYHNGAWPAMYFIGRDGVIRHIHGGEGDYAASEQVIRQLLAEAG